MAILKKIKTYSCKELFVSSHDVAKLELTNMDTK